MAKKKHRLAACIGIVLLLLAAILVMLPAMLSSGVARGLLLRKINGALPGHLTVETWTLRWTGGMEVAGLVFHDVERGTEVEIPQVTLSRGLLGLLVHRNDLGTVTITNPGIVVALPEKKSEEGRGKKEAEAVPELLEQTVADREEPVPTEERGDRGEPARLPDVRARLLVRGGSLSTVKPGQQAVPALRDVRVDVEMEGSGDAIRYSIEALGGVPPGSASISGSLDLSEDGVVRPRELGVDAKVRIVDWEIEQLFDVAASLVDLPRARGVLNAEVAAKGNLTEGLNISHVATLASLAMPDEGLEFGDINLDVEGRVTSLSAASNDLSSVHVENLHLSSAPMDLKAEGFYRKGAEAQELEAGGELAFDLETLAEIINAIGGIDIAMEGKGAEPFKLSTRWVGNDLHHALRHADASFSFSADRIDAFGVHVKSLAMPVRLQGGKVVVKLHAGVNEGTLSLEPGVDFTVQRPAIVFPSPSVLLQDVRVTGEMADELLARIHPLFKGATLLEGKMDLSMETFSWPLATNEPESIAFSGRLDFKDLRCGSTGIVYRLLETMKIKERTMEIGQRDIDFVCEGGRIRCSPMKVKVGDYDVVVSGSMGLDGTLDYAARVPVTAELVGTDVYEYVEGATLSIPIRGTVSRPELHLTSFSESVRGLVRQAARKGLEEKAGQFIKDLFER